MKLEVEKAATLTGHKDSIYALGLGAGRTIFSSGADGLIVLWNLDNPEVGQVIAKGKSSVYALAYIEATDQLLFGDNFNGLRLIDLKRKHEISSTAITTSSIFDLKIWENHAFVATGTGEVGVVKTDDLTTIYKITASASSARTIAINPHKNELAIGYSDNFIRIFSLTDYRLLYSIEAHKSSVFTLQYTPDFRYLVSGGRDAHLKIWVVENGYQCQQSIVAHMFALNNISYRPDGKYFATCSMDKTIKIWDGQTFKLLKVLDKARHAGHGTSVNKVFWSAADEIISCSDDRTISMWKIKNL